MKTNVVFAVAIILLNAAHILGEVVDVSANGFTSKHTVTIEAPAGEVFRTLVEDVGKWWDPDHTFSGDSTNLTIEAKP